MRRITSTVIIMHHCPNNNTVYPCTVRTLAPTKLTAQNIIQLMNIGLIRHFATSPYKSDGLHLRIFVKITMTKLMGAISQNLQG